MKINVGIVGYGNLGKAVEQIVLTRNDLNLVAIFSRRLISSKFNTWIDCYENIINYKGKIDIMFLCGGSFGDLEKQTRDVLENYDCINTFDNHKKLYSEIIELDGLAKNASHRLVMACGWDPGIFSNIRALCFALSKSKPAVFWGKGISMGHSEALRQVRNVFDGIEFTVPNKKAINLARSGKPIDNEILHFRDCYVVADKKYQKTVEKQIKNIPDYFKGQPTKITFVDEKTLLKLKSKMSHKGEIISKFKTVHGSNCFVDFKLKLQSNPNFTATVMVCYLNAVLNLKSNNQSGAFSPLDIPMSYLFNEQSKRFLYENLC